MLLVFTFSKFSYLYPAKILFFCSPALSTAVVEVFLLEFNMSPVLKDPKDSPETNDGAMIEAALGIVFPEGPHCTGRGDELCIQYGVSMHFFTYSSTRSI